MGTYIVVTLYITPPYEKEYLIYIKKIHLIYLLYYMIIRYINQFNYNIMFIYYLYILYCIKLIWCHNNKNFNIICKNILIKNPFVFILFIIYLYYEKMERRIASCNKI